MVLISLNLNCLQSSKTINNYVCISKSIHFVIIKFLLHFHAEPANETLRQVGRNKFRVLQGQILNTTGSSHVPLMMHMCLLQLVIAFLSMIEILLRTLLMHVCIHIYIYI